jgi:hypothetical protein
MPRLGQAHQVAERPGTLEGLHVQEPNSIEGDMGRVGGDLLFVAQIQEILAEVVIGELIGRSPIFEPVTLSFPRYRPPSGGVPARGCAPEIGVQRASRVSLAG